MARNVRNGRQQGTRRSAAHARAAAFDLVIRNGRVCDGTGSPWYRADVGIADGRVAEIGAIGGRARRTIDAARCIVCPGFIDVHTHAEGIVERPAAENFLRQGVTTVVAGNCGESAFPVATLLRRVESAGPAINVATLVGHGEIRRRVMGMARRAPTRRELAAMRRLADQAMSEGAVGLSTGLFYVPGAYARVDELVGVSEVIAAHGGVYATHARSAGGKLFAALREAAAIGRRAGIGVEVSHLKVLHRRGRTRTDRAARALAFIAACRDRGIDVTCDVHPYPATYTSLSSVIVPPWVSKGGELVERLKEAGVRRRIRDRAASNITWIGGAAKFILANCPADRSLEGRSLAEVARVRGRDVVNTALDLIVEGSPSCIFHALRPDDVSTIVCGENTMIASDAGVVAAGRTVVHPRYYGTFPRVLREYVREKGLLRLEDAVRKMTAMPAAKFGLADRGVLKTGMRADVVVFDPRRVAERTTFETPHAFPVGIRAVMVNGHLAWNGRAISSRRAGEVIRQGR